MAGSVQTVAQLFQSLLKDLVNYNQLSVYSTHWAHGVVATLNQRRNNVVCQVGNIYMTFISLISFDFFFR